MRDLFRFLYKIRNTLFFLVLMGFSYAWTITGNEHHRSQAVGTANTAVGRIYAWRTDITEYTSLRDVNLRLAKENADLRRRDRTSYAPVYSRFIAFEDTLHEVRYDIMAARVVNSTTHRQRNTLTLDKGVLAGVEPDMGVIGTDGIVGVVSAAGPRFSVVVSVLDPELNTSVVLARSGHFGLLSWDTSDPRTASVVDIGKHAPVKAGDTLVTRGGDGIFPPGIPVGVVTELRNDPSSNFHTITVRLTEDLTRSGPVYVVKDLAKIERDSLEVHVLRP